MRPIRRRAQPFSTIWVMWSTTMARPASIIRSSMSRINFIPRPSWLFLAITTAMYRTRRLPRWLRMWRISALTPRLTKEAGDVSRDAMTEPNVYWTLETPFATVVGLYTNVPEGGWLDDKQIAWLTGELSVAP